MKLKYPLIISTILVISLIPSVIGVIAEEPSEQECSIYAGEGHNACGNLKVLGEDCRKYYYYDGADNNWKMCQQNPYPHPVVFPCYHNSEKCDPRTIKEVKIEFDKDYRQDTENNRLFIPQKPITPFDDIVCLAKVRALPDAVLEGRLITKDKEEHKTVLVDELSFTRVPAKTDKEKAEESKDIYIYKSEVIKGWPNGWIQDKAKMETLIQNEEVICEVKYNYIEGGKNKTKTKIGKEPISLCVHLWGPDGSVKKDDGSLKYPAALYNFVTMRTASLDESAKWIIDRGRDNMVNGYWKVDPFRYYKNKFAHYVDIYKHDDNGWEAGGGLTKSFSIEVLEDLHSKSKCEDGRIYNLYTVKGVERGNGYTRKNANFVGLSKYLPDNTNLDLVDAVIHETGHAFCNLDDEYESILLFSVKMAFTNCDETIPFEFLPYGRPYQGCSWSFAVRTSSDSIMQGGKTKLSKPIFNVWSCAYCREEILKTKADLATLREHAEFCKNSLNTKFEPPRDGDYDIECISFPADCPYCPDHTHPHAWCDDKNNEDLRDNECKCSACTFEGHCREIYDWDIECSMCINRECVMKAQCEKDDQVGYCNAQGKCISR